jgi:ribosome-associated protein
VAKKSVAKKPIAKKSSPKKTVAKKFVATKKPVVKAKPKAKVAVKAVIKKVAPKKSVAVKKPMVAAKVAIKGPLTKTAERKAKRAAKAGTIVKAKPQRMAAPVWPPMITALLQQLDDAKAEQIVAMDLSGKSTIADTMVVASGRSGRHVNAIADQVIDELSKHGMKNIRVEGIPQCDWVLVDAGDVIVHVFRPEVRSFYNLEKLWAANVPE